MTEKIVKVNDQEVKIVKNGALLIAPEPINSKLTNELKELFSKQTMGLVEETIMGIKNISNVSSMNYIMNKQLVLQKQQEELNRQKEEVKRSIIDFLVQTEARLDQISTIEEVVKVSMERYQLELAELKQHEQLDQEQQVTEG